MKYTTIYHEDKKIEIFNSMLGKETIKVDGKTVSSKYSLFGASHYFSLKEDGQTNHYQFHFSMSSNGIVYDFYKNGKPIIESAAKSGLSSLFFFILFIGAVVFGYMKATATGC